MALTPLELQDCMSIVQAFEKGAHHSMTEESVFAVLSPRLDAMRSMAKVTKSSMEDKSGGSNQANLKDNANPAASVATATGDQGISSGESNSKDTIGEKIRECLPCDFKINFKEKFDIAMLLDPTGKNNPFADPVTKAMKDFYKKALDEINSILDLLKNLDKYVDLCAFRKFLTENVCVPDLQRILAVLTAYLMKLAITLNSSFGTIISLFGGLLAPFLSSIVDQLMKFLMAAIKPIECIVDSLQNFLRKLDYNTLFKNVENLNQAFNANPITATVSTPIRAALSPAVAEKNKEKADVAKAQNDLKALQEASKDVDSSDQEAADANRQQISEAKKKVNDAKQEQSQSKVGQANQAIGEKFSSMKGALVSLVTTLRRAAAEFEAYIKKVIDDFIKLIDKFMGTGSSQMNLLANKLQIIQLMAMIAAIIKAIRAKSVCETEGEEINALLSQVNLQNKVNIWTDDDGTIHIDEGNSGLDDIAKAFGFGDDPRQKLKGLVQFTGDKLLDSSISRAVNSLTTPTRVKFKCPLQTTVASAEQVNKWITELDAETA